MAIFLIYPPFVETSIFGPHLAGLLLHSELESKGISSKIIDINLLFIRKILTIDFLEKSINFIAKEKNSDHSNDLTILRNYSRLFNNSNYNFSGEILTGVLKIIKRIYFKNSFLIENSEAIFPNEINSIYSEILAEYSFQPGDKIAFTIAFGEQIMNTVNIARKIKQIQPEVEILAGGTQLTLLSNEQRVKLSNLSIFNLIYCGMALGETAELFTEKYVLNKFEIKQRQNKIPHLKNCNLQTVNTSIPNYFKPLRIPLLVSQGCYWGKCTFCDYATLSNEFSCRSSEEVFKEIKEYRDAYPNCNFFLVSDAVPVEFYKRLASLAIREKVKLKTSSYMLHSEKMDNNFFKCLKEAGVYSITFGTETLNNEILALAGKNFSSELAVRNIEEASKNGLKTIVNIIPDFPGLTEAMMNDVYQKLSELSQFIYSLNIQEFSLTNGTIMAENPDKYGLKLTNDEVNNFHHGIHSISFNDLSKGKNKADIVLKYYELAAKIKLRNRIKAFTSNDIQNSTTFIIDPTATINAELNEIYVESLHFKFYISHEECRFYNEILKIEDKKISLENIIKLLQTHLKINKNFYPEIYKLISKGIINIFMPGEK